VLVIPNATKHEVVLDSSFGPPWSFGTMKTATALSTNVRLGLFCVFITVIRVCHLEMSFWLGT
jgi:hypothetical protein